MWDGARCMLPPPSVEIVVAVVSLARFAKCRAGGECGTWGGARGRARAGVRRRQGEGGGAAVGELAGGMVRGWGMHSMCLAPGCCCVMVCETLQRLVVAVGYVEDGMRDVRGWCAFDVAECPLLGGNAGIACGNGRRNRRCLEQQGERVRRGKGEIGEGNSPGQVLGVRKASLCCDAQFRAMQLLKWMPSTDVQ